MNCGFSTVMRSSPKTIHGFVESFRESSATALIDGDRHISFAALDAAANRVARELLALGVERGSATAVGVCAEGWRSIVALLAVMKTGNPYVPLDPAYPQARLKYMVDDARIGVVLRTSSADAEAPAAGADPLSSWFAGETVHLDDATVWSAIEARRSGDPMDPPLVPPLSDAAAYILYTSGSTGQPKGVEGPHAAMVARFEWMWSEYPFAAGEACCHKTSLNFVDSIFEIFGAIGRGVPLVLVPRATRRDPASMIALLATHRVSRIVVVPSLLRAVLAIEPNLARALPALRYWTTSGEALAYELMRSFFDAAPDGVLLNLYGSTEVAADCTWAEFTAATLREDDAAVDAGAERGTVAPVGHAITGCTVEVLHPETLARLAEGETGEVFVRGPTLARGYLRKPELTAQSFLWLRRGEGGGFAVAPPPSSLPSAAADGAEDAALRFFRTGDFAYWQRGELCFVGRRDQQVKVRGHRVELLEVEAAIGSTPKSSGLKQGAVALWPHPTRIVGFLAPLSADVAAVRRHLAATLPEYMMPALIFTVDALPLLPNGKLDRRLMKLSPDEPESCVYGREGDDADALSSDAREGSGESPATQTEIAVAEIWATLLRTPIETLSLGDCFLARGGDSLLMVMLSARLRDDLCVAVTVPAIAAARTLLAVSRLVDAAPAAAPPARRGAAAAAESTPASRLAHYTSTLMLAEQEGSPNGSPRMSSDKSLVRAAGVESGAGSSLVIDDVWDVSSMQRGLLFHHLLSTSGGGTGGNAYLEQFVFPVVGGVHLDIAAFTAAWNTVVAKFAALRASFDWSNGTAHFQLITAAADVPLVMGTSTVAVPTELSAGAGVPVADCRWEVLPELAAMLQADRERGIDLTAPPLFRCHLAALQRGDSAATPPQPDDLTNASHVFVLTIHHILFDGWSLGLVMDEVAAEYRALTQAQSPSSRALQPRRTPYQTFIEWELSQDLSRAKRYFSVLLDGLNARSTFACAQARAEPDTSFLPALTRHKIVDADALHRASISLGITLNSMIHAAWSVLHSVYCGRNDVLYAATTSGRTARVAHAEDIIGLVLNTLPVRVELPAADVTYVELLRAIHTQLMNSLEFENCPLVEIQRHCLPSSLPPALEGESLFSIVLDFEPEMEPIAFVGSGGDASAQLMTPATVDRIGFPLSLRTTHRISGEHHELDMMATSEDARFDASFLTRLLDTMAILLTEVAATKGSVSLTTLRDAAAASVGSDAAAAVATSDGGSSALNASDAVFWGKHVLHSNPEIPQILAADGDKPAELVQRVARRIDRAAWAQIVALGGDVDATASLCAASIATVRQWSSVADFVTIVRGWKSGRISLPLECSVFGDRKETFLALASRVVAQVTIGVKRVQSASGVEATQRICSELHEESGPTIEFVVEDSTTGDEVPSSQRTATRQKRALLFCFAQAGASASAYAGWKEILASANLDVVTVELPGHGTRRDEEALGSMSSLVELVVKEIAPMIAGSDVVYHLLGASFGALLAHEVAHALTSRTGIAPATLFVISEPAPSVVVSDFDPSIADAEFVAEAAKLGEISNEIAAAGPDVWAVVLPPYRADLLAIQDFVAGRDSLPERKLSCPVFVFAGSDDHPLMVGGHDGPQMQRWADTTDGTSTVSILDGGHLFFQTHSQSRGELLSVVAGCARGDGTVEPLHQAAAIRWVIHGERDGELHYSVEFKSGLFPEEVVKGIVSTYEVLLGALAGGSQKSWEEPIMSLLEQPAAVPSVAAECSLSTDLMHERAVRRALSAERTAEAVIDAASGLRLTYATLEAASRSVALQLVEALEKNTSERASIPVWDRPEWGSRPAAQSPTVVAVVCDKSWVQVVGAFAALRAGCVYLPLDPKLPTKRVEQVLEMSHTVVVVTAADALKKYEWLGASELFGRSIVRIAPSDAAECTVAVAEAGDADLRQRVAALGRRAVEPRDLAYLIYTSGSTGVPKGVACHHEGAMNTVDDLNSRFNVTPKDRCIALSSLSFDLSVYDIFGMLGAGAAIVIPAAESVSPPDPGEWLELVEREGITIWNTVPAFVQLLVNFTEHVDRQLPGSLRTIFMSGDWIPLSLPPRIRELTSADGELRVVSMGGATEAAVWSNTFEINAEGTPPAGWSSIPYGVPMRNQTMHVLEDATMQRCELWVTGVIYIGGAGVALGYWGDVEKTTKQFIVHPHTGEYLFRTGDLGRYRPAVGDPNGEKLIEILGREDTQVKVNGFRVELGEIESAVLEHPNVRSTCAVVLDGRSIISFVCPVLASSGVGAEGGETVDASETESDASTNARVEYWKTVYEHVYEDGSAALEGDDLDKNFSGWNNSYDNAALPTADMREWAENTIERIASLGCSRVLELGVGTGLLFHRLLHRCEVYWATDLSPVATAKLSGWIASIPAGCGALAGKDVQVFTQAGHEPLPPSDAVTSFDTVILNSVAQYFPSAAYLRQVVNQMIAAVLKGHSQQDVGGRLFVGDLRSLRYLPHFHSSVEAFRLMAMSDASDQRGATPSEQLRSAVEVASLDEKELCVDPIFFTTLGEEIKHAYTRILVKRGVAINELTKYRYDTILFIGETALPPTADPSDIVEYRWSSLGGSGSLASLAQTLGEYTSTTKRFVVVRSVPNVQLVSDHALVALLASKTKLSVEEMVAASTEHGESAKRAMFGIDGSEQSTAAALYNLGNRLNARVEVTWGSGVDDVDALFVFGDNDDAASHIVAHVPSFHGLLREDDGVARSEDFTNNPMLADVVKGLIPSLRSFLEPRLSSVKRPAAIMMIPKLPLTRNGKTDRAALADKARVRLSGAGGGGAIQEETSAILTPLQARLLAVWTEVLGVEMNVLSIDDNFFHVGGDSIRSLEVVSNALAHGIKLSVRDMFTNPTIRRLSESSALAASVPTLGSPSSQVLFDVTKDSESEHDAFPLIGIQTAYWIGQNIGDPTSSKEDDTGVNPHIYVEYDLPSVASPIVMGHAIDALVCRHPMLRALVGYDGTLRILPIPSVHNYAVPVLHGDAVEATRHRMLRSGPSTDAWPLFELALSYPTDETTKLHVNLSLFLMDGFTEMILRFELASLYYAANALSLTEIDGSPSSLRALADAALLAPLTLTFRDYVCSMEKMKTSPTYIKSMNYWLERLESLSSTAELPLLGNITSSEVESDPVERIFNHHGGRFPQEKWDRVKAACAQYNVSPTCLLLTIYGISLARYSSVKSFVVNVLYTMRHPVHPDVHRVVGNFTSSILVEFSASSSTAADEPFVAAVLRTFERLWSDLDHAYVDGIEVMQDLNRRSGRTFQAVAPFAFVSTIGLSNTTDKGSDGSSRKAYEKSGITQVYSCVQTPQTWVDHQVEEDRGDLLYNIDIMEDLFPEEVVKGIVSTYEVLLGALAGGSQKSWEEPIMSLLEQPAAVPSVAAECSLSTDLMHERAVRRALSAERTAEAVIDAASGLRLTYATLEAASRSVALQLVEALEKNTSERASIPVWDRPEWGSRPAAQSPTVVAVVCDKSWVQVVGAFAALRAGCVYLPLDPKLPTKRVEQVLEMSHTVVVVTAADALKKYEWLGASELFGRSIVRIAPSDAAECTVAVAEAGDADLRQRVAALGRRAVEPRDLAYLIYTSGSTGVPKGVACHHEGAMNTVDDLNSRFNVTPKDRCIALSSLSFDLSVYDIFGMLGAGAAIVIPAAESVSPPDPGEWLELVEREGITIWNTVPAFVQLLVNFTEHVDRQLPGSLRTIFMSGDWIPLSLPPRIRELTSADGELRVVSMGGATEAAVWSNTFEINAEGTPPAGWSSIPYGVPMRNQTMHVLEDATMQRCELWVTGVIYIGGAGVALGYWGDVEKTTKQFIVHPHTGEYLFRTGDLGRYRPAVGDPNGEKLIEILGREDTQVKVNGFRIELGEIERVLQQLPEVESAITVVHNKSALATYVLLQNESELSKLEHADLAQLLVKHCEGELPNYMVPRYVTVIGSVPLNANGKVDAKQLPPPRLAMPAASGAEDAGGSDGRIVPENELETRVQLLFAEALGIEASSLSVSASFFELGGDSLTALRLVMAMQKAVGQRVAIRQLFETPSVAAIARHIRSKQSNAGASDQPAPQLELVTLQKGDPGLAPLVLVHPSGTSALCYRPLAAKLGEQQPLYAVDDSFLVDASREFGFDSIDEVAKEATMLVLAMLQERAVASAEGSEPSRSSSTAAPTCFVGGWSYGGTVAVSMAAQLQSAGVCVSAIALLDPVLRIAPRAIRNRQVVQSTARSISDNSHAMSTAMKRQLVDDVDFAIEQTEVLNAARTFCRENERRTYHLVKRAVLAALAVRHSTQGSEAISAQLQRHKTSLSRFLEDMELGVDVDFRWGLGGGGVGSAVATDVVGETESDFIAALLGLPLEHSDVAKRPLEDATHARALEHFTHCTALLRKHVCEVQLQQRCNVLEIRAKHSKVPAMPCGMLSPRGQCRRAVVEATHFDLVLNDAALDEIVAVMREFILDWEEAALDGVGGRDAAQVDGIKVPAGGWLNGAPTIHDEYFPAPEGRLFTRQRRASSSSTKKLARGRSVSAPPTPASPLRVRVRNINGVPRIVRQVSQLWSERVNE